jgi:hypothetical protein
LKVSLQCHNKGKALRPPDIGSADDTIVSDVNGCGMGKKTWKTLYERLPNITRFSQGFHTAPDDAMPSSGSRMTGFPE